MTGQSISMPIEIRNSIRWLYAGLHHRLHAFVCTLVGLPIGVLTSQINTYKQDVTDTKQHSNVMEKKDICLFFPSPQ